MLKEIGINEALKNFGGFVRYYDTTEPMPQLAALVSAGNCRNILACCGGGDQALTMLGAGDGKGTLWAVDINPAQLFVLAAKAFFLKQKKMIPSFDQLHKAYPGRITAVKKDFHSLRHVHLYHKATGKKVVQPAAMDDRYTIVTESNMFVLSPSGPFWQKDQLFTARVRARLGLLKFARMDIFDSADHFKQGSLDLIYMSDIFWPEPLAYYQEKLVRMVGLLRPGGRIISYLVPGDHLMGRGVSPARMLAGQAKELGLKINTDQARGYLVLERMKRK